MNPELADIVSKIIRHSDVIVIPSVVLFLVIYLLMARRSLRKQRAKFAASRKLLSDGAFLAQVGAPEVHAAYVIAARNALANVFKVPPQTLYPDDVPDNLANDLLYDGWDAIDAAMELEEKTGVLTDENLPEFINWRSGPETIGEWMRRVAVYLEELDKNSSPNQS